MFDYNFSWIYVTALSIDQCVKELCEYSAELQTNEINPIVCECNVLESNQVELTFRGRRNYGKFCRTKFIGVFRRDINLTTIFLKFDREFFKLPPLTPIQEVDVFLEKTIQARRHNE